MVEEEERRLYCCGIKIGTGMGSETNIKTVPLVIGYILFLLSSHSRPKK